MQSNHAIPQNVTQYQFRLVGDMTLKQFLELAGGLLLAYLFYSSNLIFLFKYPLALGSVFFGIALAFFPIEDRPLDIWIVNFIKAIYGPTRFIWEKSKVIPPLFVYETPVAISTNNLTTKTIKAPSRVFAQSTPSDLTPQEASQIKSLDSLLGPVSPSKSISSAGEDEGLDKPTVTIRKLGTSPSQSLPVKPRTTIIQEPLAKPQEPSISSPKPQVVQTPLNSVVSQARPTTSVAGVAISLPATPTTPNIISGILLDKSNKLVENAIVQVVGESGTTERAVRTNAIGQFAISTPLNNGTYYVEIECDQGEFPRTSLVLGGKVLSPIQIHATS